MRKQTRRLEIRYSDAHEKALNEMEKDWGISKTAIVKKAIKMLYTDYIAKKANTAVVAPTPSRVASGVSLDSEEYKAALARGMKPLYVEPEEDF